MDTRKSIPDWLPYVLPMALFLGITALEGNWPERYVAIYIAKIVVVAGALVWAKATWKDIRWQPRLIPVSVACGLALFAIWVGIELALKYPHLGERSAFNPFEKVPDDSLRMLFICSRFIGLVLIVPFMEELFWRSFLLRFATQTDFKALPIGTFSLVGGAITCALFALAHPEWLPALIFAAAMAALVWKTKSIFACFVAHATTNLALGVYVITERAWGFW